MNFSRTNTCKKKVPVTCSISLPKDQHYPLPKPLNQQSTNTKIRYYWLKLYTSLSLGKHIISTNPMQNATSNAVYMLNQLILLLNTETNEEPFSKYLENAQPLNNSLIDLQKSTITSVSLEQLESAKEERIDNIKKIMQTTFNRYNEAIDRFTKNFQCKTHNIKIKIKKLKAITNTKIKSLSNNCANSFSNQPASISDLAESFDQFDEPALRQFQRTSARSLAPSTRTSPKNSFIFTPQSNSNYPCNFKDSVDVIDLKSRCSTLRETVLKLKTDNRTLQSKYDDISKESITVKNKYDSLLKEIESMNEAYKQKLDTLNDHLREKEGQLKSSEKIMTLLKEENTSQQKCIESFKSNVKESTANSQEFQKINSQQLTQIKQLEEKLKDKEQEMSALYYQSNLRSIKITELSQKLTHASSIHIIPQNPTFSSDISISVDKKTKYKAKIDQQQSIIEALSVSVKNLTKTSDTISSYDYCLIKLQEAYLRINPQCTKFRQMPEGMNELVDEVVSVLFSYAKESSMLAKIVIKGWK